MLVAGSFIKGLDTDEPGIGRRIVEAAEHCGAGILTPFYLAPLPGTRLTGRSTGFGFAEMGSVEEAQAGDCGLERPGPNGPYHRRERS